MLIRIVKMGFEETFTDRFLKNFERNKEKIRNFPGCNNLELYRDRNDPGIFFTYSYWDNDESLENYRNSETFRSIWAQTKPGFNRKPEAWSVDRIQSLP